MLRRFLAWGFAGVLGFLMLPLPAGAQAHPSYARPSYASDEETIHGRIASVVGQYRLEVRDDRGFVDTVELHPGTIINPTGLTLSAGMSVTVVGFAHGRAFAANEIDTPYSYAGPYYGVPYGYYGYSSEPYPYYPYYPRTSVIIAPSFGWGYGHGGWGGYGWGGHGGGWRR